ncbi:ABC transporter permease [Mongoliitalea lutea]|uniref:Teichoic acid translocation permease protein TagG n=1 Tax=Mongoliitalea lutea TaxID=849756 RepID=A0A8J3CX60_9BACT|nr:ABC transporter permease [Mongoliitalea lutea]GHB37251.1 teichoic acid translocation permease protein TagG [Mongoliitalea lutea]
MKVQISDLPEKVYSRQNRTNLGKLVADMLADVWSSHFLARQFAKRDISAQYRQSYLGILWLFLTPIASALVWIFLNNSGTLSIADTGMPYPVYVFSGTLIWSILIDAINSPTQSTNSARDILSKVNFPKEALILSGVYKLIFNSLVKIFLLGIFLLFFDVGFHLSLLYFPLVFISVILVGTAVGLFLTPIGLLYTDVSRLITMGLTLIMYLTPVMYGIPDSGLMKIIMELNPLTPLVTTLREVAVGQDVQFLSYFLVLTGLGIVFLFISLIIYRLSIPVIVERLSA